MRLRDLCDVAYVLRRDRAERALTATGEADLELLWQALDAELLADRVETNEDTSDRGRLLESMLGG